MTNQNLVEKLFRVFSVWNEKGHTTTWRNKSNFFLFREISYHLVPTLLFDFYIYLQELFCSRCCKNIWTFRKTLNLGSLFWIYQYLINIMLSLNIFTIAVFFVIISFVSAFNETASDGNVLWFNWSSHWHYSQISFYFSINRRFSEGILVVDMVQYQICSSRN